MRLWRKWLVLTLLLAMALLAGGQASAGELKDSEKYWFQFSNAKYGQDVWVGRRTGDQGGEEQLYLDETSIKYSKYDADHYLKDTLGILIPYALANIKDVDAQGSVRYTSQYHFFLRMANLEAKARWDVESWDAQTREYHGATSASINDYLQVILKHLFRRDPRPQWKPLSLDRPTVPGRPRHGRKAGKRQ